MYEVDLHDDGINSDGWDVLFMRCCGSLSKENSVHSSSTQQQSHDQTLDVVVKHYHWTSKAHAASTTLCVFYRHKKACGNKYQAHPIY